MTESPRTPEPPDDDDRLARVLRDATPSSFAAGFSDRVLARQELQADAETSLWERWLRLDDLWLGLRWLSLPLVAASLLLLVHNYQVGWSPEPEVPLTDRLLGLAALQPELLIVHGDLQ